MKELYGALRKGMGDSAEPVDDTGGDSGSSADAGDLTDEELGQIGQDVMAAIKSGDKMKVGQAIYDAVSACMPMANSAEETAEGE
jgi:hypothetical protein